MSDILKYVIVAVISYLLGSVNFSIILSRKFQKSDIRETGSGNAGTTNMVRTYGKFAGFATIAGDMLKVLVAIIIAYAIIGFSYFNSDYDIYIKSFAGFFCVIGHIYPCYFGFKGGKGVATSGGMVLLIDWRIGLILLAVFFVLLILFKMVSLGSVVMAALYPILIFLFYHNVIATIIAGAFAVIVIYKHKDNLIRISKGTENKIGKKNKQ